MPDPRQTPGWAMSAVYTAGPPVKNPDRISTPLGAPAVEKPVIVPRDTRDHPVTLGTVYLYAYPEHFTLVRVTNLDLRVGNVTVIRLFPSHGAGCGAFNTDPSRTLTPLDPAILGREARWLYDWFQEYAESLAPTPGD